MMDTNNTSSWQICFLACLFIVCVCALCVGLATHGVENSEECVLVRPLEAVSGAVKYPGLYRVLYRGTTKGTGKACSKSVLVTESEYERVIYGDKRLDLGEGRGK